MHAVVNALPIKPDADWAAMASLFDSFGAAVRPDHPGLVSLQVVRSADDEAILVITFADEATMADFSKNVAAPWFAEHIRPFMAGPANRKTGVVISAGPASG